MKTENYIKNSELKFKEIYDNYLFKKLDYYDLEISKIIIWFYTIRELYKKNPIWKNPKKYINEIKKYLDLDDILEIIQLYNDFDTFKWWKNRSKERIKNISDNIKMKYANQIDKLFKEKYLIIEETQLNKMKKEFWTLKYKKIIERIIEINKILASIKLMFLLFAEEKYLDVTKIYED